jgi:hypothetical protein
MGMITLSDLLNRIDELPPEGIIYAAPSGGDPGVAEAAVVIVPLELEPPSSVGGLSYLLEVSVAGDVLRTWSAWRNGTVPTPAERLEAVSFYCENDSYLPTTP